jgi:hypothetical protein
LDDRNLTRSGTWARKTGTGFYLGTYRRSSSLGAALYKAGVRVKNASVIVEKCPKCGSIKIYWGSTLLHTYSLYRSTVRKRVFLTAVAFKRVKKGTLKIKVSSSGKPVIIDGLAVSRV